MYAKSLGGRNRDFGRVMPFPRGRGGQQCRLRDPLLPGALRLPTGSRHHGPLRHFPPQGDKAKMGKRCRQQVPWSKCCLCGRASLPGGRGPTRGRTVARCRGLVFRLPRPAGPTRPRLPPEHLLDLAQEAALAEQTVVRRSALKTSHHMPTKVCEISRISFPLAASSTCSNTRCQPRSSRTT